MTKYTIECAIMNGTGIKGKKGDVVELQSSSDKVKSLVASGWLKEVTEEVTEKKTEKKQPKK